MFEMKKWMLSLILLLPVLLAAGGCTDTEDKKEEYIRPVISYTIPDVIKSRSWSASGTAKDALETSLSFRVGGTIVQLPIKVGQQVEEGDLIGELDATDLHLQVRQARASLKDLEAEMTNARLNYERLKTLVDKAVVSRSEYDNALASYDSLRAKVDAQKEQILIAERNLSYTRLTAPVKGVISSKPAEVHKNIAAGETVATLNSKGALEINIGVPDKIVTYISVGQKVSVKFSLFQAVTIEGLVKEVGVEAMDSATFPVTIALNEKDDRVRSGMVAEVTFTFDQIAKYGFVSIPAAAIFGDPDRQSFVWVLDKKTSTVHKRKIAPSMTSDNGFMIKEGLEPGETIVTRGVHSLTEGQKVRISK